MQTELDLGWKVCSLTEGYLSAYMATDLDKMVAELDNPYIPHYR